MQKKVLQVLLLSLLICHVVGQTERGFVGSVILEHWSSIEISDITLDLKWAGLESIEVFVEVLSDSQSLELRSDDHELVSSYYHIHSPDVLPTMKQDIIFVGLPLKNGESPGDLWELLYATGEQTTNLATSNWFSKSIEFDIESNKVVFAISLAAISGKGSTIAMAKGGQSSGEHIAELKPNSVLRMNGITFDATSTNVDAPLEIFVEELTQDEIENLDLPISEGFTQASKYFRIGSLPEQRFYGFEKSITLKIPLAAGIPSDNLWKLSYAGVNDALDLGSPMWFGQPISYDQNTGEVVFPSGDLSVEGSIFVLAYAL